VKPTSGTAYLKNYNLTSELWNIRKFIGYTPQFDALIPSMTAREHLKLFARLKGIKECRVSEYVNEMIRALGLQRGIADEPVGRYSGGNKRKVCVGMALLGDPSIVLLDEPSAGMDPKARRFMWDLISSTLRHRSVILTTHSMEEAEALCQRIGR
jgi:ABC-type multidrug transport system ATPase subunit